MPRCHLVAAAPALVLSALLLVAFAPGLVAGLADTMDASLPLEEDPGDHERTQQEPRWSTGNWWTYEVQIEDREPKKVAVVVHQADREGFHVGTNQSGSILGLPVSGELTPQLNPILMGETWQMYRFPLEPGDGWDQSLMGYTVNTTVEAQNLGSLNGTGTVPGYELTAEAYGQTFATYTYHPEATWFDALTLEDPRTGDTVLDVELIDHGDEWDSAYYVNEPLHQAEIAYPDDLPGTERFEVPDGYQHARMNLVGFVNAGTLQASVQDSAGEEQASIRILANGHAIDSATVEDPRGQWTLRHLGTGEARVMLDVLGVKAITPEEADSPTPEPGLGDATNLDTGLVGTP